MARPAAVVSEPARRLTGSQPAPTAARNGGLQDEATSLLDQAEMARRLAEARGGTPLPRPEPVPDSESATRFVAAMGGDDEPLEDTTKPNRGQPAQVQVQVQVPVVVPQAPVVTVETDEDDLPASWQLIGAAAVVWTGVLVLAVYATLLTVGGR